MARKSKKNSTTFSSLLIIILVVVISVFFKNGYDNQPEEVDDLTSTEATVHIIDVGQGSSALIKCGSSAVLIDAGETDYGQTVCDFLKTQGVKKLDYIIASHPHSDHIGGMSKVIDTFKVEHIIMPDIDDKNVPTTRTYEKLLSAIYDNNVDAIFWKDGDESKIKLENVSINIIGPLSQNDNLNNMSLVCRVTAYKTTFMFPGDAELSELKEIVSRGAKLSAQIMIMSHHGSSTALFEPFLDKANFDVAVISCGNGNSYGHPHKEILQYLKQNNKKIYRTDKQGSISFTCNEDGYSVQTEK